jgi:hypothetical protein
MVGIFDTNDKYAPGLAISQLQEAGIIFDLVDIPKLSLNGSLADPKWRITPRRLLVSKGYEAEATALIEPLKYPLEDGNETTEMPD